MRSLLPPEPKLSIGTLLDRERAKLDALIGEVEGGIRSAVHFDELEARVAGIAGGLRDAFRRGLK